MPTVAVSTGGDWLRRLALSPTAASPSSAPLDVPLRAVRASSSSPPPLPLRLALPAPLPPSPLAATPAGGLWQAVPTPLLHVPLDPGGAPFRACDTEDGDGAATSRADATRRSGAGGGGGNNAAEGVSVALAAGAGGGPVRGAAGVAEAE